MMSEPSSRAMKLSLNLFWAREDDFDMVLIFSRILFMNGLSICDLFRAIRKAGMGLYE